MIRRRKIECVTACKWIDDLIVVTGQGWLTPLNYDVMTVNRGSLCYRMEIFCVTYAVQTIYKCYLNANEVIAHVQIIPI